ncbi:MAG: hypothetical protein ACRDHP_21085, partial [Ktedonobacterales bacterium]
MQHPPTATMSSRTYDEQHRGFAGVSAGHPADSRVLAEDRRRRKDNVGLIAIGDMSILSLVLPATLFPRYDVSGFPTVLAALVFAVLAAILNQRGAVKAAAYVLIWSLLLASIIGICGVALTNGGLDLSEVRLFDLFTIPIVLSAMTVSRRAPLALAGITSACTAVLLLVLPRTPALDAYYLQRYSEAPGSVYDIFAFALALQWGAAIVSYVGSRSVTAALHHAIQVDSLAEAQQQIAEQRETLLRQNRRLEEGIQRIQAVYAAAMRGQWTARVQSPDNELLPLALSFNRLLDRTVHFMSVAEEHQRLLAAIADLESALRAREQGQGQGQPMPRYTGTALDEICEQLRELDAPPATTS